MFGDELDQYSSLQLLVSLIQWQSELMQRKWPMYLTYLKVSMPLGSKNLVVVVSVQT